MIAAMPARNGRLLVLAMSLALAAPTVGEAAEIVVGMSAAFTGPSRGLSIELYRGSLAYFEHINQAGGVHGRPLRIKAYDDRYNPKEAIDRTIALVEEDKVFVLFDYMGTPTVTRILPLLKKYEKESILLFFPFTGAEPQRQALYQPFVFNLRPSYHQETSRLVERFVSVGRKRIAVFYQIDAYGRNGWDGVRLELAKRGLAIVAEASYERGTLYQADLRAQVGLLRKAEPDAIISIGTYSASAAFIRDARDAGWNDVPIANISGVDSDNMLRLLLAQQNKTGIDYTRNLVHTEVVPSYHDLSLQAVKEYRELMDRYQPRPPRHLLDEAYAAPAHSFISFEGYLNARLLVEILRAMGPDPKRERIREVAESMRELDLGIDVKASFSRERHQALDRVYSFVVEEGRFVALPDEGWRRWRR